ncbi:MAG TPA: zf-HC2 domain-containing protein [Symbiobacteriaceae bacterium]|nr:zf-HC2 domain-containing protein [Symbiobacteriaceae bacterium]
MALPSELECRIVEDLLVGYAAGEVHADTRDWVTLHLNRCAACRQALAQYTAAAAAIAPEPPPEPSAEPGRRLVGRVRRSVGLLAGVLVVCVFVTIGAVYFGIGAVRRFAGLPADMPVPQYGRTPTEVVRELPMPALTGCCIEVERTELPDFGSIIYQDDAGHEVELRFDQYDSLSAAATAYDRWQREFRVRTSSVSTETPTFDITKFKSGGSYYFGWRRANWFIYYSVPEAVENPVRLRDELRDFLYMNLD